MRLRERLSRGAGRCGRWCFARPGLEGKLGDTGCCSRHGREGLSVLKTVWAASVPW